MNIALALLALSAAALGDASAPPTAPPPAPDLSVPAPRLDFDLLAPDPAPAVATDPKLPERVERRRTMLKLHQGFGLATLLSLDATVVVGQLQFDDRFRGGGDTGKWNRPHRVLVITTSTLFAATGLLALLAPEPYAKRTGRIDTALVHKTAMATAALGMVSELALGLAARHAAGTTRERNIASAHQVVGYVTAAAALTGAIALLF